MTEQPFLVFGAPLIGEEEIAEVEACMRSGWLGTGPRVADFESRFAAYKGIGSDHAAAVNSCTAALHLSLVCSDLDADAEVITTPLTFCATVNAILHAGLKPVLADVDPVTQCISADAIEHAITPRTQAIVPVHFAGHPCEMDRIQKIAERHQLTIIEDCAHAIETEYRGKKAGTFGEFGCFSFYATKNVVTGEGGMIIGNSQEKMSRVKRLALHGMTKDAWHRFGDKGYRHYQVVECGYKYNMMDLQAAIGIPQLNHVESNWQRRKRVWEHYQHALADLPIDLPAEPDNDTRHAYHLYTIMIDPARCGIERDDFLDRMNTAGVGTGVHYQALPEHPYYQQHLGWTPEQWPVALEKGRKTVSLPLTAALSDSDVDRVINTVREVLSKGHTN